MSALSTLSRPFNKVRAVNANNSSYPTLAALAAQPSSAPAPAATTRQVVDLTDPKAGGYTDQNRVMLVPYGLGADGDAFNMKVVGWRRLGGNELNDVWVPVPLGDFLCTMSSFVGVAGTQLLDTEQVCDTIAKNGTSFNDGVGGEIVSPADNTPAHVVVDLKGCQMFECLFDQSTNTPTMNCLYAPY